MTAIGADSSRSFGGRLKAPFLTAGRIDWPIVALFVAINAIVALNAVLHDPIVGYDAFWHNQYIAKLAEGHLVSFEDTHEFFSPPLPYAIPALLLGLLPIDLPTAGKIAQLFNLGCSLGTTWLVLALAGLVSPESRFHRLAALGLVGLLPVYYRSFALVRGEPYVAVFAIGALYLTARAIIEKDFSLRRGIWIGVLLGLAGLSRQWVFLMAPAFLVAAAAAWFKYPALRRRILGLSSAALVVTVLVCGWFYLSLRLRYGSAAAWNRSGESTFKLSNNPRKFYLGLGDRRLVRWPVRNVFDEQIWPVFYSDMWGDYWGFFLLYGRDTRTGTWLHGGRVLPMATSKSPPAWLETNRSTIAPQLGRLNLVGVLPTSLFLLGLAGGVAALARWLRRSDPAAIGSAVIFLGVLSTAVGYFAFLVMFPEPGKGATVKATYMLQIFPLVAVLGAGAAAAIGARSPRAMRVVGGIIALVFLHNLPYLVTRFAG